MSAPLPRPKPAQPAPQKSWTPPDESKDYRESSLRLDRERNRILLQLKTRLTWIAIFTGLPYVLALLGVLFWLLFFATLAAGIVGAGAAASQQMREERAADAPPPFVPAPGPRPGGP